MLRRSTASLVAEHIEDAFDVVEIKLNERLLEKGIGACGSTHEALGVITEEYYELVHAVESNDKDAFIDEVLDIAVAAVWVLASVSPHRSLIVWKDSEDGQDRRQALQETQTPDVTERQISGGGN